ncbi:hypothetical protein O7626_06615 [Micromonospora sp. WMMD1102]|uniref:hypothetical protein n=1 Tax=Micromonospora sp. WMMD1102 TaxID=3016105 RepID=UPI002414EEE9|nr:hypothetical protein [Micromonospora sp. WMMD1102]MDG4785608.1 hypothetical protein [Micromonospora sp. WMMD1102]
MGFFDRPPVAPDPEPEPPAPPRPSWTKPESVFPGVVAEQRVLAHTDNAAIMISNLLAYPTGFEFTVTAVLRTPDRRPDLPHHGIHRMGYWAGRHLPDQFLRVGVQFADGSSITNLDRHAFPPRDAEPAGPVLFAGSAESDDRRHVAQYWVWPLPPSGPVAFVAEWPGYGIPESRAEVDGQLVIDAAARAIRLWPEAHEATD